MKKDVTAVLSPEIMLTIANDRADEMRAQAKRDRAARGRENRAENGGRPAESAATWADAYPAEPAEAARTTVGRWAGRGRRALAR
jgi:uncharacterized protein (DUF2147 family)